MAKRNLPKEKGLRRRVAQREVKALIVAYCEGEATEPKYLDRFRLEYGDSYLVEVEPIGTGFDPGRLVAIAEERVQSERREAKRNSFNRFEVWAVFDVDNHQGIPEAKQLAAARGVYCAISNPCFELWALLHFTDSQAPLHRHECQRRLQSFMPNYDPKAGKELDFEALSTTWEEAAARADRLLQCREEEGDPEGNPSTAIHLLLRSIVETRR